MTKGQPTLLGLSSLRGNPLLNAGTANNSYPCAATIFGDEFDASIHEGIEYFCNGIWAPAKNTVLGFQASDSWFGNPRVIGKISLRPSQERPGRLNLSSRDLVI